MEDLKSSPETLEHPKPDITTSLGSLVVESVTEPEDIQTPLKHQQECLEVLENLRKEGEKKALVTMATGLGKTWVAGFDIKSLIDKNPDLKVLYLAHQNDILDQAKTTFRKILGTNEVTYGSFHGETKDLDAVNILFGSFQTMRNWHEAFHPDEFDYVVIDESHHSHAPTYRPVVKYLDPKFMLAITATPDRHDLRDIRTLYGHEVYSLPLEEALAKGLLARVDYRVITDEITRSKSFKSSIGRQSIRKLNRTIFAPKRDEEIAGLIQKHTEDLELPRRVVFCPTIEYTEHLAELMGEDAVPLHSKISRSQQDVILNGFRSGNIDTLLVVDMFNEGIDIPEANQIVFLRSTQSKTVFLQQLGRGLRKTDEKQEVQVLDFVANCERILMIDEIWKNVRRIQAELPDSEDILKVDIGEVKFTEVAENIIEILERIKTPRSPIELIEEFQQMVIEQFEGKIPTEKETRLAYKSGILGFSVGRINATFGGYNNFIRAAGFEPNWLAEKYDEARIVSEYQKVSRVYFDGRRLSRKEHIAAYKKGLIGFGPGLVVKKFGNYREFWRSAGYDTQRYSEEFTKEELISEFRDVVENQTGSVVPSIKALTNLHREGAISFGWSAIRDHFGKYNNLVIEAGLKPLKRGRAPNQSDSEIINMFKEIVETRYRGRLPGSQELANSYRDGEITLSLGRIKRQFGSYNKLVKAAGYEPIQRIVNKDLSETEMIASFLVMVQRDFAGRTPTVDEFRRAFKQGHIDFDYNRMRSIFGKYSAFVTATGLKSARASR